MPGPSDAVLTAGLVREAIAFSRLPWMRPLLDAYAHDYASVASLFSGDPADPSAWRETIARVQRAPGRDRAAMQRVLSAQLERRGASPEARASLARLADPRAVAIVTGQQAGLFGGPLYTLLKAITAIQMARRISAEHDTPVVPIFWVADEDHDWAEVKSTEILDREATPTSLALQELPGAGTLPVGALMLDARVEAVVAALEGALPPTEFSADVIATLRRRYVPGASVAHAFAGWIDDLLGRHGLVVFEGGDPAAKPLVADLFAEELAHPGRTTGLAIAAGRAMRALGHAPQVDPAADGTGLFYLDAAGRHAIKVQAGGYAFAGRDASIADLCTEARQHPEHFSPNVLIRSVIQDRLFPTICYIAGPSELAYQGQLRDIYRTFNVESPLLVPRVTITLLDSASARFIERYLPLEALQPQDESALNRLLERQLPTSVEEGLERTARLVADEAGRLKDAVATIDPTLSGVVDSTVDKVRDTLKQLQAKIVQASKRKDDTLRRQFVRTRAMAFPSGHPQERQLGVAFFVNRYGPALVDRLIEGLPTQTDKHYLVTL